MSRTNCAIGKDYVPASFKGVVFQCTQVDVEGGRRGAEGEFPFGENTAYADLGRRIRVYNLTAVFREDNHVGDSQALFKVCESPGPGILVHPTRGTFMAACRKIKVKDNVEEQGETEADLEFVEANVTGAGLVGSIFGLISSTFRSTSQSSFLRDYQPTIVSQPWRSDVINTAQTLVAAVAASVVQSTPIDAPAQARRDILKIEEVAEDKGLAASAVRVDNAIYTGFITVASNLTNPDSEFKEMKKLANAAAKTSTMPKGPARTSEEAVLIRFRSLAGVGMAQAAMARTYDTVDDALTAMDQVSAVLDDEAKLAYDNCDNPLFLDIRNYTIQFKEMMNNLAYRLPPIVAVDFMGGVFPLVAAYAIYKDAKRHRELERKNIMDANGRFSALIGARLPTTANI